MLKNITLSAEEEIIRRAREKAQREQTTLNARFRSWLEQYVMAGYKSNDYETFMKTCAYASPGKSFTRDATNER